MLSVKQGGIKFDFFLKVFGMTRPGIEPRSRAIGEHSNRWAKPIHFYTYKQLFYLKKEFSISTQFKC